MQNRAIAFALLSLPILVSIDTPGAQAADTNDVLASQGGVSVTMADVDAYMQRVPEDKRGGMMDSGKRIEQLLLGLLAQKQLAKEATDIGLDKDPLVAKEVEIAVVETLARERMQRFRAELKVPDFSTLAKEKYIANKADYVVPGRVDVEHVLISTKSHGDAAARELATEVQAKAKADPSKFEALVEQYSDDPGKSTNHGLIENATTGNYAERFIEGAKQLKEIGEISGIVKSQFGYHVLKLVRHEPNRIKAFEEVRDELEKKLREDFLGKQEQDHIDRLRNGKLDVPSPELVGALRTRYLPAGAVLPDEAARPQK